MSFRIGQGYDIHRLIVGRPLILGGERIPFEQGLDGHSDADVVLHALADALLGACALGDLGSHFPPSEERWRGAASSDLLRRVVALAAAAGWKPVNCDLTVIAEAPRLTPYRESIRARVASILGVDPEAVGFKATTNEGLGPIGRGEGIASFAVVLVEAG